MERDGFIHPQVPADKKQGHPGRLVPLLSHGDITSRGLQVLLADVGPSSDY